MQPVSDELYTLLMPPTRYTDKLRRGNPVINESRVIRRLDQMVLVQLEDEMLHSNGFPDELYILLMPPARYTDKPRRGNPVINEKPRYHMIGSNGSSVT